MDIHIYAWIRHMDVGDLEVEIHEYALYLGIGHLLTALYLTICVGKCMIGLCDTAPYLKKSSHVYR
jgi:hypothetical protein